MDTFLNPMSVIALDADDFKAAPNAIRSKGVKSTSGAIGCLLASAARPTTVANVA